MLIMLINKTDKSIAQKKSNILTCKNKLKKKYFTLNLITYPCMEKICF